MRPIPKLLMCLAVLLFGTLAGTAGRAAELTLDGSTRYTIPAEINGQPLRLRVDIAASGYIVLNPDAARRAGLEGSIRRARALVGPYRLTGGSNAVRIDLAGLQLRERVGWFDRNVVEGADGVISPEILPYDSVTFRLAPERPDERVTQAALNFTKGGGLFLPYETAGRTVGVRFSTLEPRSLATAAAGALISGEQGSRWAGEPEAAVISFGISRPVREMRLDRPLLLAGLEVDRFWVRTADHRGNYALPTDPSADPGEILVTGQQRSRQRAVLSLTVGLDRLGRCSTVSYRKAGRQLALRCHD